MAWHYCGTYPTSDLAVIRAERDKARDLIKSGIDPRVHKVVAKIEAQAAILDVIRANIILLLAHHTSSDKIFLDCIIDAVNMPSNNVTPITFTSDDTADLREFVRDLPTLKYSGEEPEKVRDRTNRRMDEQNDGRDGLADTKQDGSELDFVPQLIALFKTVEILGQILKNQIASVNRNKRIELLQLLMNGPLRAIRAYFDLFHF